MKSEPGPKLTLGGAAAAHLRLIVWCQEYCHRVEPDPAEMAERLRRRDYRAGLGGEACARQVRRPSGQHGGERDPLAATGTPQGQLSTLSGPSARRMNSRTPATADFPGYMLCNWSRTGTSASIGSFRLTTRPMLTKKSKST
jgi:hypothetical protein